MRGSAAFRSAIAPGGVLAGPWVQNELWRRARAKPSLDLRLAERKSLVDATTGQNLVSFTRASSGTYVDSQGVIRTATTNLLLRSEEFDNASWSKGGLLAFGSGSFTNAITAPTGTVTADLLTEDTSTGQHRVWQTASNTVNTNVHTVSFYAKAKERTRIYVGIAESPSFSRQGNATFNLANGTVVSFASGNNGATGGTASIVDAGNGWYRCSYSLVLGGTNTAIFCDLNIVSAGTTISYTGDGTSGIYLWGAQLEQSSTVGEYIPTTSTINSAPRFDHNPTTGESLGLLVEEQRTNSIRNNTMVGAVAGTPGTLPTNWSATTPANGITREILGTGTEDGIAYIDFRFSGTNTLGSNFYMDITFDSGAIVAAQGQSWTESIYAKLIAGSITGAAFSSVPGVVLYSTPNFDDNGSLRPVSATNARLSSQRFSATRTLANATSTGVSPRFSWTIATGGTIDFTLRIGLPQLEQGAFATSVIPTTSATATRSADVASISGSNFSSWYRQDEGTVFVDILRGYSGNFPGYPNILSFNDGTGNNLIALYGIQGAQSITNFSIYSGGVGQTDFVQVGSSVPGPNRISQAIAANSSILAANGTLTAQDSTVTMPNGINRIVIGCDRSFVAQWGGHIRRLTYWPQRLSNSTLQSITQ